MLTQPQVQRYSAQSGLRDIMIAEKEVILTYVLQLFSERRSNGPRGFFARESDRGREVQRRHRGHRGQQSRRMTNPPYTRFDNSSPSGRTRPRA